MQDEGRNPVDPFEERLAASVEVQAELPGFIRQRRGMGFFLLLVRIDEIESLDRRSFPGLGIPLGEAHADVLDPQAGRGKGDFPEKGRFDRTAASSLQKRMGSNRSDTRRGRPAIATRAGSWARASPVPGAPASAGVPPSPVTVKWRKSWS